MKIGCHAVLFTDRIVTATEEVLKGMQEAQAEGLEIGARFFGVEKGDELKEKLEQHGLELSGLHVTVPFVEVINNSQEAYKTLERAAEFLRIMPNKNIIFTGITQELVGGIDRNSEQLGDEQLAKEEYCKEIAEILNEFAGRLLDKYGVQLNYHNHNWEFKNDAILYEAFLKYAPKMKFALDIGWAKVSGYDPIELISNNKGRFNYIHLRDYKEEKARVASNFTELQEGYVEIGEGDIDFPSLLRVVKENLTQEGWLIVEYEKGKVDMQRYEKAVAYIKDIWSTI